MNRTETGTKARTKDRTKTMNNLLKDMRFKFGFESNQRFGLAKINRQTIPDIKTNIKRGKWCLPKKHFGKSKNTTMSTLKYNVYCQKWQKLSKTAIFIFADLAIHRKKLRKEQELSFLPLILD